jgi:phasin family protein
MTQQPEFLDLYRVSLRSAADLMKASLESAERLQNQQLAAIRTALDQQAKSVSELGQVKSLDELMALQGKMAGAQFERVVGYWSGLAQAAGQNQMAVIGQLKSQLDQAREWLNEGSRKTS